MKRVPLGAALALLAFIPGCDRMLRPAERPIYAAWEEGLTLGYENPQLADPGTRRQNRQMVRVQESRPGGQSLTVTKTFTSYTGQWRSRTLLMDGGVQLETGAGANSGPGIMLLPEGFPDRVSRWEARGSFNWVVGRAALDLPSVRLADPSANVGVWVETVALDQPGHRTRTFYLPGVGEAETLVWNQEQGRWDITNLLVTRGFTDAPAATADTSQPTRSTL